MERRFELLAPVNDAIVKVLTADDIFSNVEIIVETEGFVELLKVEEDTVL